MKLSISLLTMAGLGVAMGETPLEALTAEYQDYLDTTGDATTNFIEVDDLVIQERCGTEYSAAILCALALPETDCFVSGSDTCSIEFIDPESETLCSTYGSTFCQIYKTCCGENYSCKAQFEAFLQCLRKDILGCAGDVCAANGGKNIGGGDGGGCFSATAMVDVLGRGSVEMQDISLGDMILTSTESGNVEYQPVYAFGHNSKDTVDKFYQIKTKKINPVLEVTGEHLVYLHGKANPVRADSIKVGDALVDSQGAPMKVSKITTVEKAGIFAPQTPGGTLLVSGALASVYPALQDTHAEEVTFWGFPSGMSHHFITHMGAAVPRVLCDYVSPALCSTYSADGKAYIFGLSQDYVLWATDSTKPLLVQVLLMAATVPLVLVCLALEMMVGVSWPPFVLAFAAMTGYTYFYHKEEKAGKML